MRIKRDKPRSIGGTVIKGLIVVTVLATASLCLAFVWQNAQEQPNPAPESSPQGPTILTEDEISDTSDIDEADQDPDTQSVAKVASQEESVNPDEGSVDESEASVEESDYRQPLSGALPKSAKVDNAYFADAIFFGDSISTGIPIYQVAGNPDTVAVKGLSPQNILTEVDLPSGETMTVLDKAKEYGEKKKVYIMLGSNGLWLERGDFVSGYKAFVDAVNLQYPGATIYLQSMPPVTTQAHVIYPTADNETIRVFNEAIAQLAKTCGVNFVDVAMALTDSQGNLPLEASPTDGMHLTPEYYQKWFDYLKTHTVEEKNQ